VRGGDPKNRNTGMLKMTRKIIIQKKKIVLMERKKRIMMLKIN